MRSRYVAMYETGEKGKNYFVFVYLETPVDYLPPPLLDLGVPLNGIHTFVWADDEAAIARAFHTSQQQKDDTPTEPIPTPVCSICGKAAVSTFPEPLCGKHLEEFIAWRNKKEAGLKQQKDES